MEIDLIPILLETFGPAAVAFIIMFLWLRSVQKDMAAERLRHQQTREQFTRLQEDRLVEMQAAIRLMEDFKNLLHLPTNTTRRANDSSE